jgi:tryptophan-rich sensory protein
MTLVLLAGAVSSFLLDWSANHLLNPAWHPHARFHGALLLFLLAGVSATGVWLLWRRSKEPEVAFKVAGLISLSFWTPLFYISSVLPGSTPWAGDPSALPHWAGRVVYPNMVVAGLFLLATGLAYGLARRNAVDGSA